MKQKTEQVKEPRVFLGMSVRRFIFSSIESSKVLYLQYMF